MSVSKIANSLIFAILISMLLASCCAHQHKQCVGDTEADLIIRFEPDTAMVGEPATLSIGNITADVDDYINNHLTLEIGFWELDTTSKVYITYSGTEDTDTLYNFRFDRHDYEVNCGDCKIGSNDQQVHDVTNITYEYNGATYHIEDTLVILR